MACGPCKLNNASLIFLSDHCFDRSSSVSLSVSFALNTFESSY